MTTTQQILDQLNTYEFDHTPETENIWQDVIADLDVDDEATAAADPSGASDRFVLTDGREFRWERSYERGRRWLDDSPAITARVLADNGIVAFLSPLAIPTPLTAFAVTHLGAAAGALAAIIGLCALVVGIVDEGTEEHAVARRQMLEQVVGANLVALVGRIREPVYKIEEIGHTIVIYINM
jgi:hypothetical protein